MKNLVILAQCLLSVTSRTTAALANAIATETPLFTKTLAAARDEMLRVAKEQKFDTTIQEVVNSVTYLGSAWEELEKQTNKALGMKKTKKTAEVEA
jgi:hypothetical protein